MARVKRTHFLLFHLRDSVEIDLAAVLRGHLDASPGPPDFYALALLTGRRERLTRAELEAITAVPTGRWIEATAIGEEEARSLAARGLLLSDEEDEGLAALRARDAEL